MVVLTIDANANGETVYLKDPIPKPRLVSLHSCAFFNTWHSLKNLGCIYYRDGQQTYKDAAISPGHYNIDNIAERLEKAFLKKPLSISTNTPTHALIIEKNKETEGFWVDESLSELLGISPKVVSVKSFITRLNTPNSYYIHCDLVDKDNNLHNGKPSDVLACIPITGKPQERVSYPQFFQNNSRQAAPLQFVNSVTLTVKDETGNDFDFVGAPLHFELEIK